MMSHSFFVPVVLRWFLLLQDSGFCLQTDPPPCLTTSVNPVGPISVSPTAEPGTIGSLSLLG